MCGGDQIVNKKFQKCFAGGWGGEGIMENSTYYFYLEVVTTVHFANALSYINQQYAHHVSTLTL
jgi:hypothetical protein